MKNILTVLLSMIFLLPAPLSAADKIRGDYETIGDLEKLKGATSIELKEFFNYSCGHCYKFLKTSKGLKTKYKDKLHHKKFPIHWGNQTPYPSMAFYIADGLGMEEKFTQELFNANFKLNINIFQPKVIKFLAKDYGIEDEMEAGIQSSKIKEKVKNGLELAKKYKANETPTLIINDVLKVTPSISKGDVDAMTKNLDLIFQDILGYNE